MYSILGVQCVLYHEEQRSLLPMQLQHRLPIHILLLMLLPLNIIHDQTIYRYQGKLEANKQAIKNSFGVRDCYRTSFQIGIGDNDLRMSASKNNYVKLVFTYDHYSINFIITDG